jgi:uncharacterized protein
MNDLNSPEVSDICVTCGMCCDGTLFAKAVLSKDDTAPDEQNIQKAKNLQMTILEENGKYFFRLPCHLFDKKCTVYDKERPKVCGVFFCTPLKRYQADTLSLDAAAKIISNTRHINNELKKTIAQYPEFADKSIAQITDALSEPGQSENHRYMKLVFQLHTFRKAIKIMTEKIQ